MVRSSTFRTLRLYFENIDSNISILPLGEGDKRGKNKKKKEDSAASSGEESDEDRPRKRGRPRVSAKDAYKGFTDAEVRKSF